jgi:phospholipase C
MVRTMAAQWTSFLAGAPPSVFDPYGRRIMGYYNETDLPYYYAAASTFATSDRSFSSVMSETYPNRRYLFAGTSAGEIGDVQPPTGSWTDPTIFQLLDSQKVTWNYYFKDNSIFLGNYSIWLNPADQNRVQPITNLFDILARPTSDQDLASVVYIEHAAQLQLDEHPGANVQLGAAFAETILDALMKSQAWQSSVFILTFDEAGGIYDHVAPIAVPPPDNIPPSLAPGQVPGGFNLSGFRVPIIVLSPWIKPGFVSHTPREMTSILKLIETRFGLPSLTARDAWADDMTEFFDFSTPHLLNPPSLPQQPTTGPCDWSLEVPLL